MDNSGCIVDVYVTLYNIHVKRFMSFEHCGFTPLRSGRLKVRFWC